MRFIKPIIYCLCLSILVVSCKKDAQPSENSFATLGLYEKQLDPVTPISRRLFIHITQLGNQTIDNLCAFDTASSGLVLDADGIIPASMFNDNGIMIPGDSLSYNGITITKNQVVLNYGNYFTLSTQVYGNLAYATVKIGDNDGNLTTSRIPFIIYYKSINAISGESLSPHTLDIFGVGPGASQGSSLVRSPLSNFKLPGNLINGFKLGLLDNAAFTPGKATYVPGLLSIGLTRQQVYSSGFILNNGADFNEPTIEATVNYNGRLMSKYIIFDTGTPTWDVLEDPSAVDDINLLDPNMKVTVNTSKGFSYGYTTDMSSNITIVKSEAFTKDNRNFLSIDFFIHNEYMLVYETNTIGLKNN